MTTKILEFNNQEAEFWTKYIQPFAEDAALKGDYYVCVNVKMDWRVFTCVEKKLEALGFKVGSSTKNADIVTSIVLSWD